MLRRVFRFCIYDLYVKTAERAVQHDRSTQAEQLKLRISQIVGNIFKTAEYQTKEKRKEKAMLKCACRFYRAEGGILFY